MVDGVWSMVDFFMDMVCGLWFMICGSWLIVDRLAVPETEEGGLEKVR